MFILIFIQFKIFHFFRSWSPSALTEQSWAMSNLVFSITSFGYWLLPILFPECTFAGSSSSKAWCLSVDCIFLYVLCKKTNLSPFFREAEGAEFIAKVTRNPLTGYVSSWQLGKILLSVSLHERSFIFPPLSLSGNILTFSDWKKNVPWDTGKLWYVWNEVPLEKNLPNTETLLRFVFL